MTEISQKDYLAPRAKECKDQYEQVATDATSSKTECMPGEKEALSVYQNVETGRNVTFPDATTDAAVNFVNGKCLIDHYGHSIFTDANMGIVTDAASYVRYVDEDYRAAHPFNASNPRLPWLVVNVNRNNGAESEFTLTITKDGAPITFTDEVLPAGPVSGNTQTLTAKNYIIYSLPKELGVSTATGTWEVTLQCGSDKTILTTTVAAAG